MVKSLDEVIERLQYKADNIKAKLEPSYFTECIEYLKSIIPCYLGSPCEYQTEDVNYNHGWVACSERLPDTKNNILICTSTGYVNVGYYSIDTFKDGNSMPYEDVIAWQPLPSPYETEQMKGE